MEGPDNIRKLQFIENALDDGWTIKKRRSVYIFTKKHEGKKEIFDETFLEEFIMSNILIKSK
jgi:hypothetical protein